MYPLTLLRNVLFCCALAAISSASYAVTISTLTLPEGNTILQVTDAIANSNPGGQASSATRTLYVFAPDFGDTDDLDPADFDDSQSQTNNAPDFPGANPGGAWPWVYLAADAVLGDIIIADASIDVTFELLPNPNSPADLQWLLIDGNPTYQFIGDGLNAGIELDEPSNLANGIDIGDTSPWFALEPDGTVTQSEVAAPIPAPSVVMLMLVAGLVARRFSA